MTECEVAVELVVAIAKFGVQRFQELISQAK